MTSTHAGRRSVDAVLADLLRDVGPLPPEVVGTDAAGGRIVAADVVAPTPLPPVARAAMDGIAVRAHDTATATTDQPAVLHPDGEVLAGEAAGPALETGHCRSIATGAPMPAGADAVVRKEHVDHISAGAVVVRPVSAGTDVRQAGEDAARGDVLVAAARRLSAAALAGIAGAGVTDVLVRRRPRVTVLPTGDEIVAGTTPDALGPALQWLLQNDGAVVTVAGPVRDDREALTRAIATAAAMSDLVLTTGGVSVGPADLALGALQAAGSGVGERLALRPGKPFAWGRVQQATVCCLPGNPGAALASAILLVRPLVARMLGTAAPRPRRARLGTEMTSVAGLRHLVPARWRTQDDRVEVVGGHGSGDLRRLAGSDALIDVAADATEITAGAAVDVWPLP